MSFSSDLYDTLVKVLTTDYQVTGKEADRIAVQVSTRYLSSVDISGSKWFELWNITLKWKALCRGVVLGDIARSDHLFAGLPLIGALRWLQKMGGIYPQRGLEELSTASTGLIDPVEAVTCMALWKQEDTAQPYTTDDTLDALLKRVNDILNENAFGTIDEQRLREAMDRLQQLKCLTPHDGWYRLKEEMEYQVAIE